MSRIAIALPYSVSIRDLVHGGALEALLSEHHHQIVIHTLNPDLPELVVARELGAEVRGMRPYVDTWLEGLLKRVYPLFFADRFAYIAQSLERRPLRRLCASLCVGVRRLIGAPALLRGASTLLLALFRVRRLPRELGDDVDLLIGTRSLINSLDYGLMAEASAQGLPVVTLAGSWDNFTTKGYFPFPVRRTVVWNEKMREELMSLFGVSAARIGIAGYPRASLLRSQVGAANAKAYLEEIGIRGYRRFVLYSASYSELTRVPGHMVPLEYQAIRRVCEALVPTLPADTCVLIRLHPFSSHEDQACFEGLPRCHVFLPGRQDRYVERVMDNRDERHLAQQIGQSACVVSMASTMSIDAMCLSKPIVNIAFDPVPDLPRNQSITRFYEYNHFRDLVSIANLPLARDVTEVVAFVGQCLYGQYRSELNLEAFTRMYVPDISHQYPQLVRQAVEEAIST